MLLPLQADIVKAVLPHAAARAVEDYSLGDYGMKSSPREGSMSLQPVAMPRALASEVAGLLFPSRKLRTRLRPHSQEALTDLVSRQMQLYH